jgi:hypothetical protein
MFGATTVRVSSLAAGTVNGPYRAEPFLGPDPGLRPGLTEAALQAACLLRLIVDGIGTPPRQTRQPVRSGAPHWSCFRRPMTGRVPAHERPNLEYGASADFPCGVVPRPIRRGGLPQLDGLQTTVRALFELDRR